MNYSDFERAIKSDALKQVAAHWNAARQGRVSKSSGLAKATNAASLSERPEGS